MIKVYSYFLLIIINTLLALHLLHGTTESSIFLGKVFICGNVLFAIGAGYFLYYLKNKGLLNGSTKNWRGEKNSK